MRTSTIISSSLFAIAVSCAPVDLPKVPVALSNLGLGSLPAVPVKVPTEFPATLPSEVSTNNLELPTKRADLPEVADLLDSVKVPSLPVGDVNLPVKRAELPVVNGLVQDIKLPNIATLPTLPKLPVDNVNLPVRRNVNVNAPVALNVDDLIELSDVNVLQPAAAGPAVGLPVVPALPKVARDIKQSLPVVGSAAVPLDAGDIEVGTVDKYVDELVKGTKVGSLSVRDIKQSLPVVGGADVPLDAGKIKVGTVDQYVDQLLKGTKIESLPKVARGVDQSLPVVGNVNVPLDAGKVQVGTVDQYADEVVEGITLKDVPVLQVVKGTTVKDLPNLGSRDIKQSLPVAGGVDVPLDAGKIEVGTVDKYVEDVLEGTTTGL